ncbi:MAG: ISAs1 family transposase [Polaromonas sp.]
MTERQRVSLMEHFSEVPDPRVLRTQRHELLDIFAMALCAVIGGADHWTEVVEFAQARQPWFSTFLKLANGIPSHDTFARVFRLVDAAALEKACQQWLSSVAGRVQGVVAIDGKSVRGSRDGKEHPLHIVSAWASQSSLLLGQVRTAKKSNEITAIPELLKLLSIQGCIVTIDAMGCQKSIAKDIIAAQADYVLSLKANHRHLCLQVASWFKTSLANGFARQDHSHHLDAEGPSSHARIERREHWVVKVPEHLKRAAAAWPGLQTVAMVRRQRQMVGAIGSEVSCEDSYYLSSLPLTAGAQVLAKAVRSHWAVENKLHWSLDVSFKEDACQVRKDNAPANLACMRRIALTQLKQEKTKKLGIQGKRRRAGWDTGYLETVLHMSGI